MALFVDKHAIHINNLACRMACKASNRDVRERWRDREKVVDERETAGWPACQVWKRHVLVLLACRRESGANDQGRDGECVGVKVRTNKNEARARY
jgi:hypothetical protein